jgi:hypothetical protein
VSVLSSEQLAMLRHLNGWMIADALLDPERGCKVIREHWWGGTYDHDGIRGWFQCEKRGISVYTVDFPDEIPAKSGNAKSREQYERNVLNRRDLIVVTYREIARYAAGIPADVREELRAARDAKRAIERAYAAATWRQPWEPSKPFDRDLWDAHLADLFPARDRLRAAIDAALTEHVDPVQLELFGAVA